MRIMNVGTTLATLGTVALAAPGAARAQASGVLAPGLEVNTLRPAIGPHAIVRTEGSRTLDAGQPTAMALFNYASLPVAAEQSGGEPIVDQQLAWHIALGLGFGGFAEIGVSLPFYFASTGFWDETAFDGPSVGDGELRAKFSLLSPETDPVGLGLLLVGRMPTGRRASFTGAGTVSAQARLIVDKSWDRLLVSANLGADLAPDRELLGVELGPALTAGLGAQVEIARDLLDAYAEFWGSTPFTDSFGQARATPLDLLSGIKVRTPAGVTIGTAAGAGLGDGFGAPEFRATVSLSWTRPTEPARQITEPAALDADEDGITNDQDACPTEPEDFDGFEDEDGCPEAGSPIEPPQTDAPRQAPPQTAAPRDAPPIEPPKPPTTAVPRDDPPRPAPIGQEGAAPDDREAGEGLEGTPEERTPIEGEALEASEPAPRVAPSPDL